MGIDVLKEGWPVHTSDGPEIVPFTGKYAAKTVDVFDQIHTGWERVGLAGAYRPLRVEFELTTKCNDTCASCGMGALPMGQGVTLTDAQVTHLVGEFADVALPSIAITGGEPFMAPGALTRTIRETTAAGIDVSKLTTNGVWATDGRVCGRMFDRLANAGLLDNRMFVPLIMVSIGEQTTPLEDVARILHHATTEFTSHELNVAVSSLADPATREHRVHDLIRVYEARFGGFPHDRVHSTMRVYLDNDRVKDQARVRRPGTSSVSRWMGRCFACFTPTVGAYINPTALVKQDGTFYTCAAFDVPERLRFGNLLREPLREILSRAFSSAYVRRIAEGGGLRGLGEVVPHEVTDTATATSFCGGACAFLIGEHDRRTGHTTGLPSPAEPVLLPVPTVRSR